MMRYISLMLTIFIYKIRFNNLGPCSVVEGFLCHVFYLWNDFLINSFWPQVGSRHGFHVLEFHRFHRFFRVKILEAWIN